MGVMLVTEALATLDMAVMPTARGLPTPRLTMADSAMPAMKVSATPDTEDMDMARGLLTLMPIMAVLATPDMEDTPTARGLPTLRLTMVVLAMPVMEVLATPDMEDTHTASKMPPS